MYYDSVVWADPEGFEIWAHYRTASGRVSVDCVRAAARPRIFFNAGEGVDGRNGRWLANPIGKNAKYRLQYAPCLSIPPNQPRSW